MNEVTNFMYYMFNKWCLAESKKVFGEMLGEHVWNKWVSIRDPLWWYADLDTDCRNRLVARANEFYNK